MAYVHVVVHDVAFQLRWCSVGCSESVVTCCHLQGGAPGAGVPPAPAPQAAAPPPPPRAPVQIPEPNPAFVNQLRDMGFDEQVCSSNPRMV